MTEGAARGRRRPHGALSAALLHPVAVWTGFVLAHLWLALLALHGPGNPLGDVTLVYRFWVEHGAATGEWVGVDTVWVYPVLALLPMVAAAVAGFDHYPSTWLGLVLLADAAALAVLLGLGPGAGPRRRAAAAAWWWTGFLILLGPVAVGRIDAFTVAVALVGLLVLAARPLLAGVLLGVAAWIKVWPAALVAAVVLAVRERLRVLVGAAAVTAAVLVAMAALGGLGTALSFLGEQTGRGLQVEAVLATPWMWAAAAGVPAAGSVAYDTEILTYQLTGPGAEATAAATTPLLVVAAALLLGLGLLALRRGAAVGELLPPLLLSLAVALIAFNKVGSPQFAAWLAVPVVYGLAVAARGDGPSFAVPAALALPTALLTQAVYPYLYGELLALDPVMLALLTARNLLYLVLLSWGVITLVGLLRRRAESREERRGTA